MVQKILYSIQIFIFFVSSLCTADTSSDSILRRIAEADPKERPALVRSHWNGISPPQMLEVSKLWLSDPDELLKDYALSRGGSLNKSEFEILKKGCHWFSTVNEIHEIEAMHTFVKEFDSIKGDLSPAAITDLARKIHDPYLRIRIISYFKAKIAPIHLFYLLNNSSVGQRDPLLKEYIAANFNRLSIAQIQQIADYSSNGISKDYRILEYARLRKSQFTPKDFDLLWNSVTWTVSQQEIRELQKSATTH